MNSSSLVISKSRLLQAPLSCSKFDSRRGASSFPDIHLMIIHPSYIHIPPPKESSLIRLRPKMRKITKDSHLDLLRTDVLPSLQQRGLIAHSVATNAGSWKGIIRMPERLGQWGDRAERLVGMDKVEGHFRWMIIKYDARRLCLLCRVFMSLIMPSFVPYRSRGAYLLALTGDSVFYNDLRLHAERLGLLLNEYGLWKWNSSRLSSHPNGGDEGFVGDASEKGYWSLVESSTERGILEDLGLDFIDPTVRNYESISKHRRNLSAL